MIGYHHSDGYRIAPLDDRDEDDPEYRIDPILSSPDFNFSEEDPATIHEPTGTPAERATFDPQRA